MPNLTTKQTAELLSVDQSRVRVLCRTGRLGKKLGRDWIITHADVKRYLKAGPRKPGRKVSAT